MRHTFASRVSSSQAQSTQNIKPLNLPKLNNFAGIQLQSKLRALVDPPSTGRHTSAPPHCLRPQSLIVLPRPEPWINWRITSRSCPSDYLIFQLSWNTIHVIYPNSWAALSSRLVCCSMWGELSSCFASSTSISIAGCKCYAFPHMMLSFLVHPHLSVAHLPRLLVLVALCVTHSLLPIYT